MAVVDQTSVYALGPGIQGIGSEVLSDVKDRVTREIKKAAWLWFKNNSDTVLFSKRLVFWTVKIKVSDCRFIFDELFGAMPEVV